MENQNSNNWVKILGILLVLGAIAYGVFYFNKNGKIATPAPVPPAPPANPPATPPPATVTRKYKDGTYTAVGSYTNPASKEEVTVELVIKDDKILSAKFTGTPDNPTTVTMQGKFKAGFEALVVGKSLDEVSLTVVNGSSLTPKGFMDALSKIKAEALA